MPAPRLSPGEIAPAFTLDNSDGKPISLSGFLGRKVVLYVYPAASTPGCTTQACDFRDNLSSLAAAGYVVLAARVEQQTRNQKIPRDHRLSSPRLRAWRNGRRAALRSLCLRAWGFDSPGAH